jgi:hypothetical protein
MAAPIQGDAMKLIVRAMLCASLATFGSAAWADDCAGPGTLVTDDPSGDASPADVPVGLPDPVAAHDITGLYFAEPGGAGDDEKIRITLKLATLEPSPPNTYYHVYFTNAGGTVVFLRYATTPRPAGDQVFGADAAFSYGHIETLPTGNTNVVADGATDPESNANADGTITWFISKSKVALENGTLATEINAESDALVGISGAALFEPVDTTASGIYELTGAGSCGEKAGSGSGALVGGGAGPALLVWMGLMALLRRRRTKGIAS